jgi:hypothetical protein
MGTMYFVLGMLSIIGAIVIATIVWGIVKISKLLKAIKQQEEWIINSDRTMWEIVSRLREELERRMDSMDHHANSYMNDLKRELDDRFRHQLDESKSYTDSRFDKATGLNGAKQLIKG